MVSSMAHSKNDYPTNSNIPTWWQQGTIYQIYPKSFQACGDSPTGTLNGIITHLEYLKFLGIDAIWLTPIYPSPQVDNGYDVANYCDIDPNYGSLDEFEMLVKCAHSLNIRVMMDMVFNHSSSEHPWFKSALDKNSPYRSFYIWKDGDKSMPPNNWQSKFGGSAWQWHDESQQYYLHLFSKEQPDLNWENPQVRDELKQICQFWADRGVDALRLDVINLVSKQQDFPNDEQGDGRRFYTDGPRIHEFLQEISRDVFQPQKLVTVGEMSSTSLENCLDYANLNGSELSMTFNFHHLKVDYPNGDKWTMAKPDFVELKRIFNHWQTGMYNKAWPALFWCNHDQPRIVSRFGCEEKYHKQSAKVWAMILYAMQGTPFLYQGEEIGMTNPHFSSIDDYRDVESINIYQEQIGKGIEETVILDVLAQKSRDNSRTPMQWNDKPYAGFSTVGPWIKVASNYKTINVEAALDDLDSIFYFYHALIRLRKAHRIFIYGDYCDLLPLDENIWLYQRHYEGRELTVLANLTDKEQSLTNITLPDHINSATILLDNYGHQSKWIMDKSQLMPFQGIYFYNS